MTHLNYSTTQLAKSNTIDSILRNVEIAFLIALFILTLIGNSILIIILINNKKKRRNKNNQNGGSNGKRMSFYVIHLSFADINVALTSILPQLVIRSSIGFPIDSNIICKSILFAQVFSVYASVFYSY